MLCVFLYLVRLVCLINNKLTLHGDISDDMLLQEDLVQMVPMISETNAMAEELQKKVGNPIITIDVIVNEKVKCASLGNSTVVIKLS